MTAAAITRLFIFTTYFHPAGCINKKAIPGREWLQNIC